MERIRQSTSLALLILLLITPTFASGWIKDKTYRFTILHTNDHHGRFWPNEQGEYGLAAQKTVVDQIRYEVQARGGSVLILSGGDINTGVPESDLHNAEPDFRGMNLIGYDAMAIGNHEFDHPLSVLRQQQQWAKFPLLSANIYQKSSGNRLFQPWALFNRSGLKIAVIGLTTDDTVKISNPQYLTDIEFREPASQAKATVETLRQTERPDVMIAVTHMGHYDDGNHGSNAPGDVEMARELPAGYLDVIVGGHSHDSVCMERSNRRQKEHIPGTSCTPDRQNGTWIVQADQWGKYLGRADFTFRNGSLTLVNYQLIPVNLKRKVIVADGAIKWVYYTQPIANNTAMQKLLTPFQKSGAAKLNTKIGSVNGRLEGDRSKVRFEQTSLAHLILVALADKVNADFAVMNSGGICDSINAGDISHRDVIKVLPFYNTLAYVEMDGLEVKKYLTQVVGKTPGSGAYGQFANVSLIVEDTGIRNVKINGHPLKPNKRYRMALLNFGAAGGNGYPVLSKRPDYVNTHLIDSEVVASYIKQHSPLDARRFQPAGEIIRSISVR